MTWGLRVRQLTRHSKVPLKLSAHLLSLVALCVVVIVGSSSSSVAYDRSSGISFPVGASLLVATGERIGDDRLARVTLAFSRLSLIRFENLRISF